MINIILPISRSDYLRPVFNCLAELEKPDDTELLIITDGNRSLEAKVEARISSLLSPSQLLGYPSKANTFKKISIINFGDNPAEDINSRRFRIAAIHNKARHYISEDCDYVFCVEDDTVYPAKSLYMLLSLIELDPEAAFAQGVELGRRNTPYVGAWTVDDIYSPSLIKSFLPDASRIALASSIDGTMLYKYDQIDAGGLYCALIDADLYRMHHFEPFDKVGANGKGLSCDLNFGLYLRQQGYNCYIDWSIQCDHIGDKGSVNLGNTKPVQVVFEKLNDKWLARTIV